MSNLAGRVPDVTENNGAIGDLPVFWRSADAPVGQAVGAPALYLHGVPTNSDDWVPFLAAGGGLAPDLPGFGRSGKPGHFQYTIEGYANFLEQFLGLVGVERVSMLVHDWGGVGLAFAQRHPERVERLVVMDCVPFLPGYGWHRMARVWRTPVVGELAVGSVARWSARRLLREAFVEPAIVPETMLDSMLDHFDQGTQRAILRLYRSADPDVLEAAGRALSRLNMPSLVVWGDRDPYIGPEFADAYAAALPSSELLRLADAGHWPWVEHPELIPRIAAFLAGQ